MTHIANRIHDLNIYIAQLKTEFEQYITDRNVSLEDRWKVFINATPALKNSQSWYFAPKSLPEDTIGYDMLVHMERYQTMTAENLISILEDNMFYAKEYSDDASNNSFLTEDVINNLKEEILEQNLGSFVYDW